MLRRRDTRETAATDVAALLATIIELTVDTGAENHMEDR
jgi:hypothetical protein